jgi:hypothetical protein
MLLRLLLLSFLCNITLSHFATAQQQVADTAAEQSALQKTLQRYQSTMCGYNALYNGIEYTASYPGTSGHPYYEWDTLQQGSIFYDGVFYPNIGLKFNLVNNDVILMGKQNLAVSLIPEKIQSFTIRDHQFIHVKEDSTADKLTNGGYYEVLYSGPTSVLATRKKNVERSTRVEDPMVFKQYNRYFVKKKGVYYPVETANDLLALCEDQKEALKTYLRKSKLNFKKNPENSFVNAVSYYDQLKN